MKPLTPDTLVHRRPALRIDIDSSSRVHIFTEGGLMRCDAHGLTVLDAFSRPCRLSEALTRLRTRVQGAQDWIDLTSTILQFYEAGILRDGCETPPTVSADPVGFDAAPIHVQMLNDRTRTSRYQAGMQEVVRPGDVVVEIGTGTGVLAVAAAKAGARHVYAIEASGIGPLAQAVFAANGLADRITLVPGWSTQVELPERADVLVSEIIGHEPLGEQVLETTRDAVQRFLKPDARLIPSRVRILGLPVVIPPTELAARTFTAPTLQDWKRWYGIDFAPLGEAVRASPHYFTMRPHLARTWQTLSDPVLLADVDLREVQQPVIESVAATTASTCGSLNGVLIYFEIDLGPTTCLSSHPAQTDEHCSWRNLVWVVGHPMPLKEGDAFSVEYTYRGQGTQSKVRVVRA